MGISESKPISKKIEKTIIKCPIETTEILASDCESFCNSQDIRPNVFSINNLNTLSSQHSINSISDFSFFNSEKSKLSINNKSLNKSHENKKKPLIQNLSTKIELLDTSLSDKNISLDEFSSSDQSVDKNSSEEVPSNASQSLYSIQSSTTPSEHSKSDHSLSENPQLFFNKEFVHHFKERYSTRSPISVSKIKLKSQEKQLKTYDGDDSFTEITNMIPNDIHKTILNNKDQEIQYLKDILIKNKLSKTSNQSFSNNSSKFSEVNKDKQVKSVPISKMDISNSSCSNLKKKMGNSLSAEINVCKPGFKCLCYKFWVDATFETWKVFHNPRDRRIESIGRLSNCQIRLTKITQRSSKGMLKRQVYVYAACLSALEKCCKLFDDKFPNFCASSGLNMESSA